ncbi:hypothetical protein HYX16_06600 [Candidatus Woesearchaeota archaeon]|nr:hypothetical protein [Candidatus Woesearchaeota archaeon]
MNKSFFLIFLIFLLLVYPLLASNKIIIYQNSACGHCSLYLNDLKGYFNSLNLTWEEKNIINNNAGLSELNELNKNRNIPFNFQGHMTVVFNNLVLEGHIPILAIKDLVQKYPDYNFPKVIFYQDSMDDLITSYKILDQNNNIKECDLSKSFEECSKTQKPNNNLWNKSLLFLVLFNGLLAGIHPCTISVLLLFLAFLFTIRKTKAGIFKAGLLYITGIFLAYFGIGLGIFKAISISSSPHFAAKISGILILILGLANLISFFTGKKNISLGIPKLLKPSLINMIQKASLPAAFFVGFLVGICSFGCTAGIYLSIMSLLLVKASYMLGVFYLIIYNLMFILPLIVILMFASSKRIVLKMEKLEMSEKRYIKLIAGLAMIASALILLWIAGGIK